MSDLTYAEVSEMLHYDQDTGKLRWKVCSCPRIKSGSPAGRIDKRGYGAVNIRGRKYASHRLAWLLSYGEWPKGQIDHINRDPGDNRISNLRVVTGSVNCQNREMPLGQSGERGVCQIKGGKWQVSVCRPLARRPEYVGTYSTIEDARAAYISAKERAA